MPTMQRQRATAAWRPTMNNIASKVRKEKEQTSPTQQKSILPAATNKTTTTTQTASTSNGGITPTKKEEKTVAAITPLAATQQIEQQVQEQPKEQPREADKSTANPFKSVVQNAAARMRTLGQTDDAIQRLTGVDNIYDLGLDPTLAELGQTPPTRETAEDRPDLSEANLSANKPQDTSASSDSTGSGMEPMGGGSGESAEGAEGATQTGSSAANYDDVSDAALDYFARTGLDYNIADFIFDGSEDEWKQMVQDEVMKKWYLDKVYDEEGNFSDELWDAYWAASKAKTFEDSFNNYSMGSDADIIRDILRYANERGGYMATSYDNVDDELAAMLVSLQSDPEKAVDAMAAYYMAGLAQEHAKEGMTLDWDIDDVNKMMALDPSWEVGYVSEGYHAKPQQGEFFGNYDPEAEDILYSDPWIEYDEEGNPTGNFMPVNKIWDAIFYVLPDEYGYGKRQQ